jgi:hypothetical protein
MNALPDMPSEEEYRQRVRAIRERGMAEIRRDLAT